MKKEAKLSASQTSGAEEGKGEEDLRKGAVYPNPHPGVRTIPGKGMVNNAIPGGLCPFGGGGASSTSNTMWPGPRPTCMPSLQTVAQKTNSSLLGLRRNKF